MIVYLFYYQDHDHDSYYISPKISTVMEYWNISTNLNWSFSLIKINKKIRDFNSVSKKELNDLLHNDL